VENYELPNTIGTNGLHAARCNRINDANGIVLAEDRFAAQEPSFLCPPRDLSTFGKRKVLEEFNPLHEARYAVEGGLGRA
jgi:hypothetical protein